MKYTSKLSRLLFHEHTSPDSGFPVSRYPKSWHRQTNYSPIDPAKDVLPELDDSPEAKEARTTAAKHSLLIPLAAILGVIAVLVIGVLIKTNT